MSNLIKANQLKKSADRLIYELGLGDILNKYSKNVFYTGSYFLDVMAWSDLDISLVLNGEYASIANLMNLTKELSLLKGVKKIVYRNFMDNGLESNLPRGLYNGVYWQVDDDYWKIDLWAVNEESLNKNKAEMQRIKEKLDSDKKHLILKVKHKIMTEEGRTPSFSGYNIYKAVVDEKITSEDNIIEYLRERKVID